MEVKDFSITVAEIPPADIFAAFTLADHGYFSDVYKVPNLSWLIDVPADEVHEVLKHAFFLSFIVDNSFDTELQGDNIVTVHSGSFDTLLHINLVDLENLCVFKSKGAYSLYKSYLDYTKSYDFLEMRDLLENSCIDRSNVNYIPSPGPFWKTYYIRAALSDIRILKMTGFATEIILHPDAVINVPLQYKAHIKACVESFNHVLNRQWIDMYGDVLDVAPHCLAVDGLISGTDQKLLEIIQGKTPISPELRMIFMKSILDGRK